MIITHNNDTTEPTGVAVSFSDSIATFALGIFDGANASAPTEPDYLLIFEDADAARAWLSAATASINAYIAVADTPIFDDPGTWSISSPDTDPNTDDA